MRKTDHPLPVKAGFFQAGGEELLQMDQYEYIRTAHRFMAETDRSFAEHDQKGLARRTVGRQEREQPLFPVVGRYRLEEWLKNEPKKQKWPQNLNKPLSGKSATNRADEKA